MSFESFNERKANCFGNRLKTCGGCPETNYDIECGYTWHNCTKGHYKNITALPIDGECPDFPKPEDNVPGEVIKEANKLKELAELGHSLADAARI